MNKRLISLLITGMMLISSIIPVCAKSLTVMHDVNNIAVSGSADVYTTGPRIVSSVGYNVGNKEYVYSIAGHDSANQNQALVIYDVTDTENISVVQSYTNIVTKVSNNQLAIKDGYLFVVNNLGFEYYTIGNDGLLSGSATRVYSSTKAPNWCTLKIVDDYLFFAEAGSASNGKCMSVYDVSDIASGVTLMGTTQANFGVFNFEVEKISDTLYRTYYNWRSDLTQNGQKYGANGFGFAISDMTVNQNGTVTFEDKFKGAAGFENISDWWSTKCISLIGENKAYLVSWYQDGTKKTQYIIDAANPATPVVTEIDTVRAASVIDIDDNYYAVGEHALLKIRRKADNSVAKSVSTTAGESYELRKYNGKLLVSGNSKLSVIDLYSELSIEMSDIAEINDSILNINASVKLSDTDALILDVFGEQTDVTNQINNGTLAYSKNISVADGDYTAKLIIKRNDTEILSEQKNFTVRKTMPIEITHSGLTVGTSVVTGSVENTHTQATSAGKVYLVVYNSDGSMAKAYVDEIPALAYGETDSVSFTMDNAIASGQIVKIFAVDNEGRVLSDIIETASQSFNTVTDKIPSVVENSVNIYAEVDAQTVVAEISGKSANETENIVFVTVYKPEPDNTQFDYINAFKTLNDGGFYLSYPLQNGTEGENYTVKVYASVDEVLTGEKRFSYISQGTIDAALLAVKNATASTFESVAISESSQYKNIFNLNTAIYDTLIDTEGNNKYKLAVGNAVAGTLYADIAALNTAFDNAVNEQKAIMDADNTLKAAIADINTSAVADLPGKLEGYNSIFELNITGLYTKLDETMKGNLYSNWIHNKGFNQKSQIQSAFAQGMAIEYLKLAQFGSIVDDSIIETYFQELGFNSTDVQTYSGLGTDNKKKAVAYFLELDLSDNSTLGSKFNEALSNYNSGTSGNNNPPVISGGGGGGGITVKPNTEKPPQIQKEDLIPQEVLNVEKKNPFKDVSVNDWFFEAVCVLNERKVVEGITVDEFKPQQNVKREEFAKMIICAFDLIDYKAQSNFKDVETNRWYYSYVATAQKLNLINGIGNDIFGVGKDMTRQDLAKLVYDTLKTLGKSIEITKEASFSDMDSVSDYAKEAVNALYSAGIMNGFEDKTFKPHGTVTRAMAAQVIYNIAQMN